MKCGGNSRKMLYTKSFVESQSVRATSDLTDKLIGSQSRVHDKIFTGSQKTETYLDNLLSHSFTKQDEFNLKDCSLVRD